MSQESRRTARSLSARALDTPFSQRLLYMVYVVGFQLDPFILAELRPLGLTGRTVHLLRLIADSDGTSSQRELADRLGMDPTLMVIAVDSLENAGLIHRQRSTIDRRRYDVMITPEGIERLTEAEARFDDLEEAIFSHLAPAEREQFRSFLRSLFTSDVAPTPTPH